MLSRVMDNTFYCDLNWDMLREVTIKIGPKRINIQKGVIVEALLNNRAINFIMSLKFARKQQFKLKKIERPILSGIQIKNRDRWKIREIKIMRYPVLQIKTKSLVKKNTLYCLI